MKRSDRAQATALESVIMDYYETAERRTILDLEKRKHALANFLEIDPRELTICMVRINNIATFQVRNMIYLVGTKEEVQAGIRGYFEHNLADLDSKFIGQIGRLSDEDKLMVIRLCELLIDIDLEVLNQTLLTIVDNCGDARGLIDAAASEVDRGELLALDGVEHPFGEYLIYKFREGKCSDFGY
jgi:hypothetical protein